MARKIETVLIDDIDGSQADTTIRFGLNGAEFEIDLNAAHAAELRKTVGHYVEVGRRASGSARQASQGTRRRSSASGLNSSEIRDWAKRQGMDVKDRGRMPSELIVKFRAATDA
jgi:hypothetical protein